MIGDLDNASKKFGKKTSGMKSAVNATEEIRKWTEHTQSFELNLKELKSSMDGLDKADAEALHKKYGDNALSEKDVTPWYINLIHEFTGFFSLLLWFGGILCFIGYAIDDSAPDNLFLGSVLIGVVLITGFFSYYQTSKAASLMADFKNFIPKQALVKRNGEWIQIEATKLVPGDIIHIKTGERIPADVILYESNEMKVNNASLTGESEDLLRDVTKSEKNIFETPNVAFFGTNCTNGEGRGVVFKTGDSSVIGRIAGLATSADSEQTTLNREIERFILFISSIAIFLGVSFFIIGVIIGYGVITNVIFAIGIIVANVPEGLLVTVTVALALTARRMAGKFVLVKNMEAVETLGSTSCICSDKTGTLTQNRMSVSQMFVGGHVIDASVNWQVYKRLENLAKDEHEKKRIIKPAYDTEDPVFKLFIETIALSTVTYFVYTPPTDEVRKRTGKKVNKSGKNLPATSAECIGKWAGIKKAMEDVEQEMIVEEEKRAFIKKNAEGDASETGLVKFIQPLLMGGEEGLWNQGGIDGMRTTHPVVKTPSEKELKIPFSSLIKFNAMVRDNNKDSLTPKDEFDNCTMYLKGAPERVITRCANLIVNIDEMGQEELAPIDVYANEIEDANKKFGGMGERVLAFAKLRFDPKLFNKSTYEFDISGWKKNADTFKEMPQGDLKGWFPMYGLNLVGLCSLNDPPRPAVDNSVIKCRRAGIKVIMVTGDQPPTAAAIAHKVNIIREPEFEYAKLRQKGMSEEEAMAKCKSIVIHGDELARTNAAEEAFDDNELEKGRKVMDWIRVPEVVFARTTPEQKLLIVDACQKLGHVVAVTGDGVNDSPAIKKANIGVAMGSGSDVAQNAADMVILNDDFSSIVNGVEEGRLIFDNLKKSIAYTLTSNIPEIWPFIFFIIFSVPLPLTTVLILCIDLGTDMVPAIAFAYEHPELDIMERYPRNSKVDYLVGKKMISFSYLQIGMMQQFGALFCYFFIMNDYGIKPATLFSLDPESGYLPKETDVYDPTKPNNGNTNVGDSDFFEEKLNWLNVQWARIDIRLFYHKRPADSWSSCRWQEGDGSPEWYRHSYITDRQICYTTESLKHAHTAYLVSIVCLQWADNIISRTRMLSIAQQGLANQFGNFGLFFESALIAFITYAPIMNLVFQTRGLALPHLGVPAFPWVVLLFLYDEMRRTYVRYGIINDENDEGRSKLIGWVARNTYY
jgi:sodium/potassium-transporting ATPase subunit alpha